MRATSQPNPWKGINVLFRPMIPAVMALLVLLGAAAPERQATTAHPRLSDYGFFTGPLSALQPAAGVLFYDVNAPLFSDYAEKARFIALPDGARMAVLPQAGGPLHFPVGTALIKNFFYYHHAAHPERGRRILETRLLIREENGWTALEYVWNDDQTDALLEVAGASFPASWIDAAGKKYAVEYVAPNVNQCKGCHSYDGEFVPLGTTVRQLNRELPGGSTNQLLDWQEKGLLQLPPGFDPAQAPRLRDYRLPPSESSNISISQYPNTATALARSYLDANCGHCHNPHGPASTSGMYLDIDTTDPTRLGVGKPPVAAGRGSGKRKFGIVPGKPEQSILMYRMENGDPGIRMPEVGRQLMHKEGVELVKAWIRGMEK